jgi:long-chain fatty acid transport protein
VQFRGIDRVPLRFGYTYSSNPIEADGVFFSAPAPAIIENAVQFGLSFEATPQFSIHAGIHKGLDSDVSGEVLNPMLISASNPLGKVPGSSVTSRMNTTLALLSISVGL